MSQTTHPPASTLADGNPTNPARHDKSLLHHLQHNLREYGMLITLVAIMGFFQYMTEGMLMQPLNLTNLVLQNSYIVIMALGMLLVIVAGHIDLSVGSVCGFIGRGRRTIAMVVAWAVCWLILAALEGRVLRSGKRPFGEILARGLTAAVLGGAAFYLMLPTLWGNEANAHRNYLLQFAAWTVAWAPGILAIAAGRGRG